MWVRALVRFLCMYSFRFLHVSVRIACFEVLPPDGKENQPRQIDSLLELSAGVSSFAVGSIGSGYVFSL